MSYVGKIPRELCRPDLDPGVEPTTEDLIIALLDKLGHEVPNPKPLFISTGLNRPPTLEQQIARVLKRELSMRVQTAGHETFEEANDLDIDDGFDVDEPLSPYQDMVQEYLPEQPAATPPPKAEGGESPAEPEGQTNPPESEE